jgi:hypothetical protein
VREIVVLMSLSVAGVAALFIALWAYLFNIMRTLEEVGGPATRFHKPANYLAKVRMGVRAIEVETGHIAPEVTKLNSGLGAVRDGMRAIDANLGAVMAGVSKQGA